MASPYLTWGILIGFGATMWWISPRLDARNRTGEFFRGEAGDGGEIGAVLLTSSLLISWIFAKSIQNAADLGNAFGAPGGLAYAAYWLSFLVAGFTILRLRRQGYRSIHEFIRERHGEAATWVFSVILVFRLWNEIWSNTMVVGTFFGESGTVPFLTACWAVTAIVLAYSMKSGLRSSILTDAVQMLLAAVLLVVILGYVWPRTSPGVLLSTGSWTLAGGVDLILVALIQVWSYPFHDPVMTDRGFLTREPTMIRSFVLAGVLGVAFVFLFSMVGIHNGVAGIGGNSTIGTAATFGVPMLVVMNVVLLTSAASTLDSTFASTGKLIALEVLGERSDPVGVARVAMVVLAVLGGWMVHAGPAILSATTVSGTMVVGLTPVFLLSRWSKAGPAAFHASVALGVVAGVALALGQVPYRVGDGKYGALLWVNAVAVALCFVAFVVAALAIDRRSPTCGLPAGAGRG